VTSEAELPGAGAKGSCDVAPKGDPLGLPLVLDDRTIALHRTP
jgi:hypothetical protein